MRPAEHGTPRIAARRNRSAGTRLALDGWRRGEVPDARTARVDRSGRATLRRTLLDGQPTPGGASSAGGVARMHQ